MNYLKNLTLVTVSSLGFAYAMDVPSSSSHSHLSEVSINEGLTPGKLGSALSLAAAMDLIITYNPDSLMADFLKNPDDYVQYIPHLHALSKNEKDSSAVGNTVLSSLHPLNILYALSDKHIPGMMSRKEIASHNADEFIKKILDPNYQVKIIDKLDQNQRQNLMAAQLQRVHKISAQQKSIEQQALLQQQRQEKLAATREYLVEQVSLFVEDKLTLSDLLEGFKIQVSALRAASVFSSLDSESDNALREIIKEIFYAASYKLKTLDSVKNLEDFLSYLLRSSIILRLNRGMGEKSYDAYVNQIVMMYMDIDTIPRNERLIAASNLMFDNINLFRHYLTTIIFHDARFPNDPGVASSSNPSGS